MSILEEVNSNPSILFVIVFVPYFGIKLYKDRSVRNLVWFLYTLGLSIINLYFWFKYDIICTG